MSDANTTEFSLEDKVEFLKNPASYDPRPAEVDTVETHMAWVFLADGYAYKLKKPIERDEIDFLTIENRRKSNEEEIRLNCRLAPGIYLENIPLTANGDGMLHIGGEGAVVDWLVQTRRLPAERMLDEAIKHKEVTEQDAHAVAEVLATFYRDAEPEPMVPLAYRQRFESDIEENRAELLNPAYDLPHDRVEHIADALLDFLAREATLFEQRVTEGHIIEGHGDLKPEHVCLLSPPIVFDCMDFNRDFRILDPANELALLALESARLEAHFIGPILFDTYRRITGDDPPERLINFYKAHRAFLRARIEAGHIEEPMDESPELWRGETKEHLQQAAYYVEQAAKG